MTQIENTTDHVRGKHLTKEDRITISNWTKMNATGKDDKVHVLSNREIAQALNVSPQTINNEIKRGTVRQIRRQRQGEKVYEYSYEIYSSTAGQAVHDQNRSRCGRTPIYSLDEARDFLNYADQKMLDRFSWSPAQVVMGAYKDQEISQGPIPCTTTLYNWIDAGRMRTRNIDLAEKLARKPRKEKVKPAVKVLGRSIEQRPEIVDSRQEFGHWEIDSVVGQRQKGDLNLLTFTERKTRFEEVIVVPSKESWCVNEAIRVLQAELGSKFNRIFKTITADNGSEFSGMTEVIPDREDGGVYYAHPYASYERGSNERNNKIIRKIYPKGQRISSQPLRTARETSNWMNNTPRRSLKGQTPTELIQLELQAEFQAS